MGRSSQCDDDDDDVQRSSAEAVKVVHVVADRDTQSLLLNSPQFRPHIAVCILYLVCILYTSSQSIDLDTGRVQSWVTSPSSLISDCLCEFGGKLQIFPTFNRPHWGSYQEFCSAVFLKKLAIPLPDGGQSLTICAIVLIQYQSVKDRQIDRRTDRQTDRQICRNSIVLCMHKHAQRLMALYKCALIDWLIEIKTVRLTKKVSALTQT